MAEQGGRGLPVAIASVKASHSLPGKRNENICRVQYSVQNSFDNFGETEVPTLIRGIPQELSLIHI